MPRCPLSLTLSLAAIAAVGITGCGDNREAAASGPAAPASASAPITNNSPDWTNDPTLGGKYPIAAYGVSERMMSGENMMRDRAMNAARTEIARIIQSKIQSVFKDWTREGGEITSQDNKQMAMTMAENVSRNVTNQTLSGTAQRARWIDPASGRLYVWVYLDSASLDALNKQVKSTTREDMEKRAHFASKIEADKAFADLDKLVDKQMQAPDAK